jgi:hypothetical protein
MLATALAGASPYLLFGCQVVGVALGVRWLAYAERAAVGNVRFATLAVFSVSLLLCPANMMTEAFSFFCAAGAVALFMIRPESAWGFVLLVIAALIKPQFFLVTVVAGLLSLRFDRASARAILVAGIFIAPQLVLTYVFDGVPHFSSSAQFNINRHLYPAVAGMVTAGHIFPAKSPEASAARAERPQEGQQVEYVLRHPRTLIKTWAVILVKEHLFESTGFATDDNPVAQPGPGKALRTASLYLNLLFICAIPLAVLGAVVFVRNFPVRAWPAVLIGPSLIGTAPMIYWTRDRVVFCGLLLILPFVGIGVKVASQWIARDRSPPVLSSTGIS